MIAFPNEARRVLHALVRVGEASLEQIMQNLGMNPQTVREAVRFLVERGVVERGGILCPDFLRLSSLTPSSVGRPGLKDVGAIIPVLYQFSLLSDKKRLDGFASAIRQTVQKGSRVVDLGCGTGILSLIAAPLADEVVAVERDPMVYRAARQVLSKAGCHNVRLLNADALRVNPGRIADVVICEMLDTGLIAEPQLPVMNHAVRYILRRGGETIPSWAESRVSLADVDFRFEGHEFPLPHFLGKRQANRLLALRSGEVVYHRADFTQINSLTVNAEIPIVCSKSGRVNALRITTRIGLPGGVILKWSEWLNPPLALPLKERDVDRGDVIVVHLKYRAGGGFEQVRYAAFPEQ